MRLLSVLLGVGLVLGLMVCVVDQVRRREAEGAPRSTSWCRCSRGGIVVPLADSRGESRGPLRVDAADAVACATSCADALRAPEEQYQALNGQYARPPDRSSAG